MEARSIRAFALLLASAAIVQPAYAQRPSRAAQVVLIARMPDTFSVRLPEATQETLRHEAEPLATSLAFQTIEHLIPGTTIMSACLITKPKAGRAVLADTGSPTTARQDAADSTCDGIFHFNLREQFDSLEHNLQQKTSAVEKQLPLLQDSRLDIFFSAF